MDNLDFTQYSVSFYLLQLSALFLVIFLHQTLIYATIK